MGNLFYEDLWKPFVLEKNEKPQEDLVENICKYDSRSIFFYKILRKLTSFVNKIKKLKLYIGAFDRVRE